MRTEGPDLAREKIQTWSPRDLRFVVDVLLPEHSDPDHIVALLQEDRNLLEGMLKDERLFQHLMVDDESFFSISPLLFFRVLLMRARRDLRKEVYTIERRHLQKVALFDANQVVDLLGNPGVFAYLAKLMASFTRINSVTIPIRVRPGIWRKIRINDLDVDSLIRYAQALEEEHRYPIYRRIGDTCLFLSGVFPEYIESRQRYPHSGEPRVRMRSTLLHSLEDYESYGRTFFRLASGHSVARVQETDDVLEILAERFVLAEKPLSYVTRRYVALRKHQLFELK